MNSSKITRRRFLQMGSAALMASVTPLTGPFLRTEKSRKRPNLLLIITDQHHQQAISAHGNAFLRTPALDQLVRNGVSFQLSYSANPLCSPARASLFTGRTSSETGVYRNQLEVRRGIPNLGEWLKEQAGYETLYFGKWHLPRTYQAKIPGFRVLNTGLGGLGYVGDITVANACQAFLMNRSSELPFFAVVSLLQPHDICEWLRLNLTNQKIPRYPEVQSEFPPLPANFAIPGPEPEPLRKLRASNEPARGNWEPDHWRYYLWSYFRHVEMVDAEIGKVLAALELAGLERETLVIFTADHGEGLAEHQMVRKTHLYDASVRVPLVFRWPGHFREDVLERETLAAGYDVVPTVCDIVGVKIPPGCVGRSLRPVLEGSGTVGREYVVSEVAQNRGRMVRSKRYKYVAYANDPTEQLFDMDEDPGETVNLATNPRFTVVLEDHRRMLREWEAKLDVAPGLPHSDAWWRRG